MFLYDRNGNNINVYSMEPNHLKLMKYRHSEMKRVLAKSRLYYARTNGEGMLGSTEEPIFMSQVNKGSRYRSEYTYHELAHYKMSSEQRLKEDKLLERFYKGEFTSRKIVRIKDFDKNDKRRWNIKMYLLLTDYYYLKSSFNRIKEMHGIIAVTKSLYLLSLLEKGEFGRVIQEDQYEIGEQLNLFDISDMPCDVVKFDEMRNACKVNLLKQETISNMEEKIVATQKVLHIVRNQRQL